jgi:hypothetical protein
MGMRGCGPFPSSASLATCSVTLVSPVNETFVIGGPLRLLTGLGLAIGAGALIRLGQPLDWGLAWMAWIPAGLLVMIAMTLVRRTTLRLNGNKVDNESGWLWRRSWSIDLTGASLELVPTSGLWTVIIHRQGRELPLAAWLPLGRAEKLLAWLDQVAPDGAWPRVVSEQNRKHHEP